VRPLRLCVGALVILGLVGCSPAKNVDGGAIPIGALLPFTGSQAADGTNLERAIIMAIETVNAAGGVAGRPLRLVSRDTQSDVERGLAQAKLLIEQDGVRGIIGPEEGDLAGQLLPVIAEAHVLMVSGGVTLPSFPVTASQGYFFRIAPKPTALANVMSERMFDAGIRNLGVAYVDDAFGTDFANSTADQFRKLGGQVAVLAPLMPQPQDTLSTLLAPNPDGLVLIAYPAPAASLIGAWATSARRVSWYFAPSLKNDLFVLNVPPMTVNGMLGVSAAVSSDAGSFSAGFAKRWSGDAPLNGAFFAYDAVALLALAMESAARPAGTIPANEQIRDRMKAVSVNLSGHEVAWYELDRGLELVRQGAEINYRGCSGSVDLDDSGEVTEGLVQLWNIVANQIVDGDLVLAMPQ
jgi:neutral amino acid transport system substrate-binding protein